MSYIREHVVKFLSSLTIEPLVLLYNTAAAVSAYAAGNLLIQKACYPDLISEPDYDQPCPNEETAQKLISDIGIWRPFLEYPLTVLVIIFLGAWSDTHGKKRKLLCLVPIVGDICTNGFLLFTIYYWKTSIHLTAAVSAVVHGMGGSAICFAFGAFTYISDITTVEQRTMRIGIISAVTFIGTPLGTVLGGVLRKEIGFFKLFALSFGVNIVTLILASLTIRNTATVESKLKTFEGICDPSLFISSLKTVFKKRQSNKRCIVILMLLLSPTFLSLFIGEPLYLYFRYKFHYDEVEFGYYSAYKSFTIFLGNIFSVYVCSKLFKMTDAAIGCLATITQSIYVLAMCFLAQHRWQLYLFSLIDLMQGTVYTTCRSITSKTVDGLELAQVLSVFGAADSVVPLLVYPVYNVVYKLTLETMPGEFFFVSLVLIIILFVLFLAVFLIQKATKINSDNDAPT